MAQKRMLDDFKAMVLKLNKQYAEIYKEYDEIENNRWVEEVMEKEFNKGGSQDDMDDYREYLKLAKEMEYHPATAWSVNEAKEMSAEKKRIDENFDSQRIGKLLDEMYGFAEKMNEKIETNGIPDGYDTETVYDFIDKLKSLLELQKALIV